jgi:hypothetical protein
MKFTTHFSAGLMRELQAVLTLALGKLIPVPNPLHIIIVVQYGSGSYILTHMV